MTEKMLRFMNMPEEYSSEDSRFLVVPIPYEGRVTWMRGSSGGPSAILKASYNLEYYDEQFKAEPFLDGIRTLPDITPGKVGEESAVRFIEQKVSGLNLRGKFPVFLGGDHSVTIGVVRALEKTYSDFGFLVLDAHSDLRESWNGSRFNHACTTRRVMEKHPCLIVGLRSQDSDEAELLNGNVRAIRKYEFSKQLLKKQLDWLPARIYVSVDVDVFDPSFVRGTGTPEPGGFFWDEVIDIFKEVFRKDVIASDIVEFAPVGSLTDRNAEAFSMAKLAYKMFAMKSTIGKFEGEKF